MKSGVILLNKPRGITSFQALGAVKRSLGHGKVGHTGTLDKFAEGLMIVLCGKLTRLAGLVESQDKTYEAVMKIGEETSTLDPEGEVLFRGPVPDSLVWASTASLFQGEILQKPPEYSAIHIDGKRAYERALAGEILDIKARPVTIFQLEIIKLLQDTLKFSVHCSKGTYIRSLARDWSRECGTFGHLISLKRLSIGKVDLKKAVDPQDFLPERDLLNVRDFLPLWGIGEAVVKDEALSSLLSGKNILPDWFQEPLVPSRDKLGVFDETGELQALIIHTPKGWAYGFVGR